MPARMQPFVCPHDCPSVCALEAAPPNCGAVFHDTAVWLRAEPLAADVSPSTPERTAVPA